MRGTSEINPNGLIRNTPFFFESVDSNTETTSISNNSIAIASGAGTTTYDNLITVTTVYNSTPELLINSNETTDIRFNVTKATGVIKTNFADGTYKVSYSYYPDNYIESGASRAILRLLKLFFALAIVAIAMLVFTKSGLMEEIGGMKK